MAAKFPAELSGGMTKRVALARALALDPEIVFLDEPTSGLDPIAAGEFDALIRTLQRTLGLTVFMVTHDLESLYLVCDRVAALADGKIVAEGPMSADAPFRSSLGEILFRRRARRRSRSLCPRTDRGLGPMEIKARYVLVGLFTLFVIFAGFAFVYWLETTGSVGKRTNYDIRFQNDVSGLLAGSAVLFNGIRVGEVTSLRLAPDRPKEVDATIAIDARTPMRADTQVGLEFQGLTGVAVVTLTGGSANAPGLQASAGQPPLLIASEAAGQSMSESARQVLGRLDKILSDNASDIRTLVTNLSSFSEALGKNSGKVDSILAGLERMTGGGESRRPRLHPKRAAGRRAPTKPIEKQLAIPDPNALLTYNSERVLEQRNGDQIAPLGTAKWADSLTKLMQAKIVQSFENNGATGQVTRPVEGMTPDYQLLTEIRKFQIVTEPERTALAEITAKLVGNEGHVVAARTFSRFRAREVGRRGGRGEGAERGFREDTCGAHPVDGGGDGGRSGASSAAAPACARAAEKARPSARVAVFPRFRNKLRRGRQQSSWAPTRTTRAERAY